MVLRTHRYSVAPSVLRLPPHTEVGRPSVNGVFIGSGNGLSPDRRQAITWTNNDWSLIRPRGINFSEIRIKIHKFSVKKTCSKMSSAKTSAILFRLVCVSMTGAVLRTGHQPTLYLAGSSFHLASKPDIYRSQASHNTGMGILAWSLIAF